ncbi:MAG: ThiF family adenylyltransferase [Candidatus Spechtbacteria bacterium]|nr:ThiF family adenylyltransferase [Candidatus Spechtbacteria bacterium]
MQSIRIEKDKQLLPAGAIFVDTIPTALKELCVIRNPALKSAPPTERAEKCDIFIKNNEGLPAVYVYYPWRNIVARVPSEEIYLELRTARNKNIITKEEQETYRAARVGIIGLSVGSNVINALVFSGGPKNLKIADYDVIEITNLNRLRAPVFAIGMNKTDFAAQQVWELDPFSELDLWTDGVNRQTLEKFILEPKLDVFIDEMDSLELKLLSRIVCREHRIPVVMATDNGDNVILDVERFDEEPERPILHGLVEGVDPDKIAGLAYSEWVKVATRIVDPANLTQRMRESLSEIGKTIAAVPQLGTTATIAGSAVAYAVRKITTKQDLKSGRYIVYLDNSNQTIK